MDKTLNKVVMLWPRSHGRTTFERCWRQLRELENVAETLGVPPSLLRGALPRTANEVRMLLRARGRELPNEDPD